MFKLVYSNASINTMVNAASWVISNTHNTTFKLLISRPLSCSSHLFQLHCLRSWCQQLLSHSLVQQTMHGKAWCISWRLTHNVVCCYHHSCLFKNNPRLLAEKKTTNNLHSHFSSWLSHFLSLSLLCGPLRLCSVSVLCKTQHCLCVSLPAKPQPVQLWPHYSHFSAHVQTLFSHHPLIYSNSTYIANSSLFTLAMRQGGLGRYLLISSKITLNATSPTHYNQTPFSLLSWLINTYCI